LPTSRTNRRKERGFTLIELMVVVVIIAILAVIAVPLFGQRFRQQRVLQAAQNVAETYRGARARALGRGAAIVVTFTPGAAGVGTLSVLEGVQGTTASTNASTAGCDNLPTRGCLTNDWGNLGGGAVIGTARVITTEVLSSSVTTTAAVGTTAVSGGSSVSVCFSPGGRAYVNTLGTWVPTSWSNFSTVLDIGVTGESRTHRVVVLPNGTARLGL
jgi:prepilin-type N-terminal cleavage/methylation domain-containing protein